MRSKTLYAILSAIFIYGMFSSAYARCCGTYNTCESSRCVSTCCYQSCEYVIYSHSPHRAHQHPSNQVEEYAWISDY